jgi:outer membrane protein assembly factor BamA
LKNTIVKIFSIILLASIIVACKSTEKLGENEFLLVKNDFEGLESSAKRGELISLIKLKPNTQLLGYPLRLNIYNLAHENPENTFDSWLNKKTNRQKKWESFLSKKQLYNLRKAYIDFQNGIKKTGEPPHIIDLKKIAASKRTLKKWYWNHGWFNAKVDYKIERDSAKQKAKITYKIKPNEAYRIDSIQLNIPSKVADSIYQSRSYNSFLKSGDQFLLQNFEAERNRITELFRDNGLRYFQKERISFNADTLVEDNKINIDLIIESRQVTKNDSTYRIPYKIKKISQVNIFTDYTDNNSVFSDSIHYKDYVIYGKDEISFKPKVLTDAVFIEKGDIYRKYKRDQTNQRIANLGIFDYPTIRYQNDPRDESGKSLIANILLSSKKRYGFEFSSDISQSNIQDFGIGLKTSFLVRNLFKNAKTLKLSGRGNFGSSNDVAKSDDRLFNIFEFGVDLVLKFPKIVFPISTKSIIDNTSSPFTRFSLGYSTQQNIGLDRRSLKAALGYRWKPRQKISHEFNLMDIQFVKNLNSANYFNVFQNSYNNLNQIAQDNINQINPDFFNTSNIQNLPELLIPSGTSGFINSFRNNEVSLNNEETDEIASIIERKERLTENNLIIASNYTYDYSSKKNLDDKEFSQFRWKLELAGNLMSFLSEPLGLSKNKKENHKLFDVAFSQYVKTEVDYIKHWELSNNQVIASRAYAGIVLPYGNANSIPFIRSFFAGGPNDNRGWQPYDLGPGSTNGVNDFNEANFKLAFNGEYRFNLLGNLNSAFFIDIGNIWNVANSVNDPDAVFNSISDLQELSIASGLGLRYNVEFFVIRVDLGFKTYNPGDPSQKWFRDYNFSNAVFNFGINYPF